MDPTANRCVTCDTDQPTCSDTTLWAIHRVGFTLHAPIPMPDRAHADRKVAEVNAAWTRHVDRMRTRHPEDAAIMPDRAAYVVEWPYTDESHAEALAELATKDTEGWLR